MRARTNLVKFLCLMMITCSAAHAFDLEDYATTYRATRDAYLKAANEQKLAEGPWRAASRAWIEAEMIQQIGNGNAEAIAHLIKLKSKIAQCGM